MQKYFVSVFLTNKVEVGLLYITAKELLGVGEIAFRFREMLFTWALSQILYLNERHTYSE